MLLEATVFLETIQLWESRHCERDLCLLRTDIVVLSTKWGQNEIQSFAEQRKGHCWLPNLGLPNPLNYKK